MMRYSRSHSALTTAALLLVTGISAQAQTLYQQTNLVSDIPGLAPTTDPNLKNPWGVSFLPGSPFWVSDQVTGVSTLYTAAGARAGGPLIVTIPGGNPTGQVSNPTSDFLLSNDNSKALFIFSSLSGGISGWNGGLGTTAQQVVPGGSVYTGLAMGTSADGNVLYAANASGNRIDVFDKSFQPILHPGSFSASNVPAGFTPYGIQNVLDKNGNSTIYVTYERRNQPGGFVNAFDANGNFLRAIGATAPAGVLDEPWGVTLAPSTFGMFANDLLVGNKGDGHISAFDPVTGQFQGQLIGLNNQPIANTGLWGLTFGLTGNDGDPNTLFFAAGINNETNGLFGRITAVPEPGSMGLLAGLGVTGGLLALRQLRRKGSKRAK